MSRSLTFRVSSAITALATVWCLGCSSFEPLLAALVNRDMPCDAPVRAVAVSAADEGGSDPAGQPGAVSAVSDRDDSGVECGCAQTCVAASLGTTVQLPPPAESPFVIAAGIERLPSVDRPPLIPPPEIASA